MEILNTFGFDVKLFVAQIVNFLILAFIFKKFLYKPILNMLKQRENKIKRALEDAEETRRILEQTEKKKNEILKDTRTEAKKIIDDAKEIADKARGEMLESSRKEAEKIISSAKEQGILEMEKLEKRVKIMALDISYSVLQNVIKSLFSNEEKEKILKKAVKEMEKN